MRGRRDAKPADAASSPPSAMPVSTSARISASATECPLTKSSRKRNQTTSSASRQNPDRNAAVSQGAVGAGAALVGRSAVARWALVTSSSAGCRDSQLRWPRPPGSGHAANAAVPWTPIARTRYISPAATPITAPAVFHPYRRPSAGPNVSAGGSQRFVQQRQRDAHRRRGNEEQEKRQDESRLDSEARVDPAAVGARVRAQARAWKQEHEADAGRSQSRLRPLRRHVPDCVRGTP